MELVEILKRGFEYDRWANLRWIAHLGKFRDLEKPFAVLEHILMAQRIWLERCGVELNMEKVNLPMEELFVQASRAWIDVISDAELDELITYQNFKGEEYIQPLGDIAMHVINHGSYHRGHLRGLAQAEGDSEFPETDLILYLREV